MREAADKPIDLKINYTNTIFQFARNIKTVALLIGKMRSLSKYVKRGNNSACPADYYSQERFIYLGSRS